jgi:hypothetical protein
MEGNMRLLLVGLIALSGCSTLEWVFSGPPPQPFTAPDGRAGYMLTCGSMAACYNDARAACKGDYEVLAQNERTFLREANEVSPTRTDVERTMSVACKA